jgi:hypothetical protein
VTIVKYNKQTEKIALKHLLHKISKGVLWHLLSALKNLTDEIPSIGSLPYRILIKICRAVYGTHDKVQDSSKRRVASFPVGQSKNLLKTYV